MATFSVHIDGVLLYKLCQAQSTVLGYREYYMAIWGYEFYLRALKVSLTSERSEQVRDTFSTRR